MRLRTCDSRKRIEVTWRNLRVGENLWNRTREISVESKSAKSEIEMRHGSTYSITAENQKGYRIGL